jgi:hypothetical protein
LSHKFLGPYASPFKVLENKVSNTYKLELSENLKVHPTFHVSLFKPINRDASRPNQEHNLRPPPNLVHNELEFEVEVMLKSRQLKGREREYFVKWKVSHFEGVVRSPLTLLKMGLGSPPGLPKTQSHLDICNINYGRKKGQESNWQFDSRPLKVKNRPNSGTCR